TRSSNREVSRESSLDRFGRWRCALRRHVGAGIGDAHQNLAAAASDLALGQSARYVCNRSRCRWRPNYVYRPQAYGPSYYSYVPSFYSYWPMYYAPSYFGYGGGSGGLYGGGLYGRWWW